MSQTPRWYRKQQYVHELGLDSPNAGLLDHADAQARREAVERKLRQDDIEFARQQNSKTNKYLRQLSAGIGGDKNG